MVAAGEEDATRAAQAFRPNARPMLLALLANVVLAALCLGVPYWRGHARAEQSLRSFSRFAACLFGARPRAELGLGLPPRDTAHFAAQVMRAGPDWPGRCRKPLLAIAHDEAIFLWPSVKQTSADVRAAVQLLDRELLALARARQVGAAGRVPAKPLLLVSTLRGVLTLLARAADAGDAIDSDAIAFGASANVIDPSRLPLVAGASAALEVWAGQDGLHALALDKSGISWLRLEGGKVDRLRVRRSSLVRAGLRDGDRPVLVWAMPEAKCEQQEDRCVHRGTGIASLADGATELPRPTWLAGHPASRPDRSVLLGLGGRVDLLTRASAASALEVRRFELASAPATIEGEQATPLAAAAGFEVPAAAAGADALLLGAEPRSLAYAVTEAGAIVRAWLWAYEAGGAARELGTTRGPGGWIEACEAAGARVIAFGGESELSVVRVPAQGAASTLLPASGYALGPLLPRDEDLRDRVRLSCEGERALLMLLTSGRELFALRCDASSCAQGAALARDVTAFDAVLAGEHTIVAFARANQPQLGVLRLDARGAPLGKPATPAPCWDPSGGMCGQPTLATAPGRLILSARDGSDLLALESQDGGQRWHPLRGLKVGSAISTDVSAPMQQHRIRKGLDK